MKKVYIYLFLVTFLTSCDKSGWDTHYDKESNNQSIIEVLESMPEYSEFTQQIKESGYSEFLKSDGFISIFVPTNEAFTSTQITDDNRLPFVEFSIIEENLFSQNIIDSTTFETFGGKLSVIELSENREIKIDGVTVIDKDIACSNGVIHGINMIRIPVKNIYEYISSNNEFSLTKQLIDSYEELVFDVNSSVETGMNSEGDITYDSAFTVQNKFLDNVLKFNNEKKQSTLFLLKDEDLESIAERDLGGYFVGYQNFDLLRESYYLMLLEQVAVDESYLENEIPLLLLTAGGNLRNIDTTTIIESNIKLSNGIVHIVNNASIPTTKILEEVIIEGENPDNRTLSVIDGLTSVVYEKKFSNNYWFRFVNCPKDNGWISYNVPNLYSTTYSIYYGSTGKYDHMLQLLVDDIPIGEPFSSIAAAGDLFIGDIEITQFGDYTITIKYVGEDELGEVNLDYIKLIPHQKELAL